MSTKPTMAERRRRLATLAWEQTADAVAALRSSAGYFRQAGYPDAADTSDRIADGLERDIADQRTGPAYPLPKPSAR